MKAEALTFDIFALAKPKTYKDMIALADEAIAAIDSINDRWDEMFARHDCEIDEPVDA